MTAGAFSTPLRDSSYGIFLIHHVPMLWLQYALFNVSPTLVVPMTAMIKAFIVLVATLALSWAAAVARRKIPGAAQVL